MGTRSDTMKKEKIIAKMNKNSGEVSFTSSTGKLATFSYKYFDPEMTDIERLLLSVKGIEESQSPRDFVKESIPERFFRILIEETSKYNDGTTIDEIIDTFTKRIYGIESFHYYNEPKDYFEVIDNVLHTGDGEDGRYSYHPIMMITLGNVEIFYYNHCRFMFVTETEKKIYKFD